MCLLMIGWRAHPELQLVVAANRDERHQRPTLPLHRWEEGIVAGRDREAGGTWLGVSASGRFASVTNLYPPTAAPAGAPSRGGLVRDFLVSREPAAEFVRRLATEAHRYAGFNLVVADGEQMLLLCSRGARVTPLEPGVHGIANDPPGTPLAKVNRTRRTLEQWLRRPGVGEEPLFAALTDRAPGHPEELAGAPPAPQALTPPFLVDPVFGTRSSTLVRMTAGEAEVVERSWNPAGEPAGEVRLTLPTGA